MDMNKWMQKTILGVVACGVLPVAAGIDWESTLKPRNLVWENKDFSDDWENVAFIGDGRQGASILLDNVNANDLRVLLSRYDIVEYPEKGYWPRVFAGNVIISPKGTVADRTMEQDLFTGVVSGTIRTDKGTLAWKAFAEREHNVIVVGVRGQDGEDGVVPVYRAERPVDTRRYFVKSRHYKARGYDKIPFAPEAEPLRSVDGVQLLEQPMNNRGGFGVAFQQLENDGWSYLLVALSADPGEDQDAAIRRAAEQSLARVRRAAADGVEKLTASHVAWWNDYSRMSYLKIDEDPRWEMIYQVQLYKFASASAENSSYLIDNQGLWPWHCGWAGTWWNLNVQLSYFPMCSANRLAAGRSMINGIDRIYKAGTLHANAAETRAPGITCGRTSDYRGKSGQGWCREFGNLTWVLHNYWKYWRYGGDEQVGRKLFPMLKDNVAFLTHHLERKDDGKLHMQKSRSPEYTGHDKELDPFHPDTNYGLMSLDWALQALLAMNAELGLNDPAAKVWEKTLADLVPLPVAEKTGFMVNADMEFDRGHRHYSHLLAIYPYHTVNVDQGPEARALVRKSIDNWHSYGSGYAGYSYTGGCAMYATLGEGDRALELLDKLPYHLRPNTMYREGGGPVIETPLSTVESVNYLLLQSWGGVVRVFPAVPSKWKNVEYRDLLCEGAHRISAKRVDGETQSFSITAGKDGDVRIKTDLARPKANQPMERITVDGVFATYKVKLRKGETLTVEAGKEAPSAQRTKQDVLDEWQHDRFGIFIEAFAVDALVAGKWQTLFEVDGGMGFHSRKLSEPVTASDLRVRITKMGDGAPGINAVDLLK
jgi:hypothetical protein